jgi:AraC-like DNA-binding protein/tetratricopeptide (TPR) repeat protein
MLLTVHFACQSPETVSDSDRRTLTGMIRQADSFPDRAIGLTDSAIRILGNGQPPDTVLYRFWMAKARALLAKGSEREALRLFDSTAALAEEYGHWAAQGRICLMAAETPTSQTRGGREGQTDRVGYARHAVLAFDRAEMPLEKAKTLSLLGYLLPAIDPVWAVDTLTLALDLFKGMEGFRTETISCAYRIGYHSFGLGKPDIGWQHYILAARMALPTADSPMAAPILRFYAVGLKEKNPDSALHYFKYADRIDPGVRDPLNYYREGKLERSDLLVKLRRLAEAGRDLQECLTFAVSEKRWSLAARTELKLGECAYLSGDRTAAGNHFRRALAIADTNGSASAFVRPALERYLQYGMDMGDSSLTRHLRKRLSSPALTGEGAAAAPGVVTIVPTQQDKDMMPVWLNRYIDRHPILVRFMLFGLMVTLVGLVLLKRRTVGNRIKNFESYLRILREGRTYRASMFAGGYEDSTVAGLNRKAWVMFRLEEWLLSETPFRNSDFGTIEMAKHMGISLRDLDEAVKSHVAVDAGSYLDHLRVERSISFMKDPARKGLSMTEIAKDAGFKGLLHFRKVFRIVTQLSPARYRVFCRSASS